MNDQEALAAVRASLTQVRDALDDVHMRRPATALVATARARQRRRRLSGGALGCALLAVTLLLTVLLPASGGRAAVHVNLAAWSVNTNPDGTVTVATRSVADPGRLQRVLAQAGVPARVRFGELCWPADYTLLPQQRAVVKGPFHTGSWYVTKLPMFDPFKWVIVPAAMPQGSLLQISELHPVRTATSAGAPLMINLIRAAQPATCSMHAPDWARFRIGN